jgi:hypothetical protein
VTWTLILFLEYYGVTEVLSLGPFASAAAAETAAEAIIKVSPATCTYAVVAMQ